MRCGHMLGALVVAAGLGCPTNGPGARGSGEQPARETASVGRTIELIVPVRGDRFTRGSFEHLVTSEPVAGRGGGVRVQVRLRNSSASQARLEIPACSIDLRLHSEGLADRLATFSLRKAIPRCRSADRHLTIAPGDSITFTPSLYADQIGTLAVGRYELRVFLPWLSPTSEVAAGKVVVR